MGAVGHEVGGVVELGVEAGADNYEMVLMAGIGVGSVGISQVVRFI